MSSVIDLSRTNDRREVAPASDSTALISVIERAARDPNIDIDKMERLLAMQERIFARTAEADFNAAMALCQSEMPRIVPTTPNEHTKAPYAALDEVDRVARPIYTRHGFALSFGTTDCPIADFYRQTCKVSHRAGHSETRFADLPVDTVGPNGKPNKTGVQGFGSTMTYGQRYITKLVFNIVIGGEDNDGNGPTLNKEQIAQIEQRMKDAGTDKAKFLGFWKVDSLEKIPAFNFDPIMGLLDKSAKRIDPRGDLSNVVEPVRDKHVSAVADMLNSDKEEADIAELLREYVAEALNPFPDLYTAVMDKLATDGIISKANFRKYLQVPRRPE